MFASSLLFFQVFCLIICTIAFLLAIYLSRWVKKQPSADAKVLGIGTMIASGSDTFLKKEYRVLIKFCIPVSLFIFFLLPAPLTAATFSKNLTIALSYLCGTVVSAMAGKIGIKIATIANVKTAKASTTGIGPAFITAFRGGSVMGMAVVASSLLFVTVLLMLTNDSSALLGFSFGASSLALFAKAGGGIFTKTADISADLAGKVELSIPEDDPRNPAVIADNVGDNVGDVAGMGADLFDSNVASLSAALVMALSIDSLSTGHNNTKMVFCYAAIGLLASVLGILCSRMRKKGNVTRVLNNNTYLTTAIYAVATGASSYVFHFPFRIWLSSLLGLLVGVIIGLASNYFTDDTKHPVKAVAKASEKGPAFTILSGISYGLLSTLPAIIGIGISAVSAYLLCDPLGPGYAMFGISMAAVGMLSIVGMIISNDAYGPIVDNARGLVEMGGLGEEALKTTDALDSAGNTVKAVTKGFAIGAAGLTVIALLGTFLNEINAAAGIKNLPVITKFDLLDPLVFFGLLVGAAIPAVFSALLMLGVNRNAQRMVAEIHRQFNEIKGLKEGNPDVLPDYNRCIGIATTGALKELIPAGLITIIATLLVGFIGGVLALGGFLAGNIISGLLLALFMSNSGGLWDNTKKYIEAGHEGGKNSAAHKAAVIGDTVGDPFKDTAGPSINTQITVVSLIASLTASLFLTVSIF